MHCNLDIKLYQHTALEKKKLIILLIIFKILDFY